MASAEARAVGSHDRGPGEFHDSGRDAGHGPGGSGHAVHYLAGPLRSTALRTSLTDAAGRLGFPHGSVVVVDATTLHTLACTGSSEPAAEPRDGTPADLVVTSGGPVVLSATNPEVATGPAEQVPASFLGVPLRGREGTVVGALCVTDDAPRAVTEEQVRELGRHALVMEDHLDLHRRRSDLRLTLAGQGPARRRTRRHGELLAEPSTDLAAATAELRRGLQAGEIVPRYEPVVDLRTGRLHGAEALARWQHPRWGLLNPAEFVPLAEDSDLILDLDLAVLDQAVRQVRHWHRVDPGLRVNVNLSGRHLAHLDCVERVQAVVAGAGVDPASIGLEITEGALVAESREATEFVGRLRASGFHVLLDDFGTGWSSMAYLLRLPVDGVKIDRSFSSALSTRTGGALVRAVVALAGDLGLDTVIEGIGTAAAAEEARDLGCHLGQGRCFSAPVAGEELIRWRPAP